MVDTIVARASAPGRAGISVVRVSGPLTQTISEKMLQRVLFPRTAHHGPFWSHQEEVIDEGIAIFFKAPFSFTGEDVLEFQAHGSPFVVEQLIESIVALGARMAMPGEFTQRAFLNDKMDLAQAEAVADLIDSHSRLAARSALKSMQGVFSKKITTLSTQLTELRMFVESSIDFSEEEIDLLQSEALLSRLKALQTGLLALLSSAREGVLLKEGARVLILGRPNVGKSSLMNTLTGMDTAIVTDIAGTTRDINRADWVLDGVPFHLVDTAGIRETDDPIEKIGIQRAKQETDLADLVLIIEDSSTSMSQKEALRDEWIGEKQIPVVWVQNKIDLQKTAPFLEKHERDVCVGISVKEHLGVSLLKQAMLETIGVHGGLAEDGFIARKRHVQALTTTKESIDTAWQQFQSHRATELLAEDLKEAQAALGEITGHMSADDLLGTIFSSFCIGK